MRRFLDDVHDVLMKDVMTDALRRDNKVVDFQHPADLKVSLKVKSLATRQRSNYGSQGKRSKGGSQNERSHQATERKLKFPISEPDGPGDRRGGSEP